MRPVYIIIDEPTNYDIEYSINLRLVSSFDFDKEEKMIQIYTSGRNYCLNYDSYEKFNSIKLMISNLLDQENI